MSKINWQPDGYDGVEVYTNDYSARVYFTEKWGWRGVFTCKVQGMGWRSEDENHLTKGSAMEWCEGQIRLVLKLREYQAALKATLDWYLSFPVEDLECPFPLSIVEGALK